MENDFSALKSIQELKNLLDSGAITPQEYEVLKRKIIFGNNTAQLPVPPVQPPERINVQRPVVPPPIQTTASPHAVEGNPLTPEYQRVPNVNPAATATNAYTTNLKDKEYFSSDTINQPEELTTVKRKDWLLTIVISLAVILLIGLVAYQFFGESESERLTSISNPDAEEVTTSEAPEAVATTPEPATPEQVQVPTQQPETATPAAEVPAEATTPAANTTPVPANETPVTTETTTPSAAPVSAPKLSSEEALNKIKDRLQAYYADMKSAPFAAQNHFAPTVERYYTLTGTTPQAINENISSYHFNEFQDSQSSIEDGSLKMVSTGDDGYEVTYIEHGSAFRKSKGQKQETTARVRAKFDQNFRMTYFRQEQLLENRFFDQ